MSDIEPLEEINRAKINDNLNDPKNQTLENLITKLDSMKSGKTLKQIRDELYERFSNKSVYSYVTKSTKQLFTMLNSVSAVKRTDTVEEKLSAILESQKVLASLIIQQKMNNRQLHEFKGDNK